jgi:hypothetical protein
MNRTICKYLSLLLVLSIVNVHADDDSCRTVTPKFTIRSQGANAVRRIVNTAGILNVENECGGYGTFSITPEYTRSFRSNRITRCLFGEALCGDDALLIQGSAVSDRNDRALLADYFYLPTDFSSIVRIEPRIQSFLVDFNFFMGFDTACVNNLYFWVQAPITWTKWTLGYREQIINPGTNGFTEGYFTPNAIPRSELLNSFSQFAQGAAPGNGVLVQDSTVDGVATEFITTFQGLNCARICPGSESRTRVSEVRFAFGWNFLMCDDYHVGVGIEASAPTGNKVRSDALFAPQNGNDHHWELGGQITAHYAFCRSEDEDSFLGLFLDANITHMFRNHQRRCFDVCDKPLSRYMLVEKLGTPVMNGLVGSTLEQATVPLADTTAPSAQFQGVFAPLANITSLDVDVKVGVHADVVFWFNRTCGPWSFDLGYNFWGRSCEKIRIDCECPQEFQENTWAFKGTANVYGFANADNAPVLIDEPVALSATMSQATILGAPAFTANNANIDNPQFAYAGGSDPRVALNVSTTSSTPIMTSIDPVFITQDDINFAGIKGISNKIFTHIGYTCMDEDSCYSPYFGIGFEAEFGQSCGNNDCDDDCNIGDNNCNNDCDNDCDDDCDNGPKCHDCVKCALSQWGVWAKFGVAFN